MLTKKTKKNRVVRKGVAEPVRSHGLQDDALADEVDAGLGDVLDAARAPAPVVAAAGRRRPA